MIQRPRILKNKIDHLSKRGPPPFFHLDTNHVLGNVLVHSVEKSDVLVVTVELIWLMFLHIHFFNIVQTPNKSRGFLKFRTSYKHCSFVVQTNHCQICRVFFCLMCAVQSGHIPFLWLFLPNDSTFA